MGKSEENSLEMLFSCLTNAFSKKLDNHLRSTALFYMWYTFATGHQTLRVTPAMEAGLGSNVGRLMKLLTYLTGILPSLLKTRHLAPSHPNDNVNVDGVEVCTLTT
jgi:hypothetical protein